ncbi:MAG: hypothetical protein JWN32_2621 [Solirubrobacterales bacterium]|nr:hypothetical protein [Solirubrobacterales bacterium]
MLVPMIDASPAPAPATYGADLSIDFGLEAQVQNALNLFLPLKNPTQMPALMALLRSATNEVHAALSSLHYVHFARFLPSTDGSVLMVITAYDGGLESYIMDFVGVLGDAFTEILQYIAGAPPLPVQRYAREFTEFVMAHNLGQVGVWSAYPEITVIDILRGARRL